MDAPKPLNSAGFIRYSTVAIRRALHSRYTPLMHCCCIILLVCGSAIPLIARSDVPEIQAIIIRGNQEFAEYRIRENLPLQEGVAYSSQALQNAMNALSAFYQGEGYLAAVVRAGTSDWNGDTNRVVITILIEEGPQSVLGGIEIEGNRLFTSDELREMMGISPGSILSQEALREDLESIVSSYEQNGHPFASASVAHVGFDADHDSGLIRLRIVIDEGPEVMVNEVRVKGAESTMPSIIIREAGVRIGERYDHSRVRSIPARLSRMNIFARIEEPELYLTDRGGSLLLAVEEGNTNTFDGVIGYLPAKGPDENGLFTGMVNVTMRNLFGTGRRLQVRWQREDRLSQEIGLRYLEPWIFDLPLDITGGFRQRQQDSAYVQRDVEIAGSLRVSDDLRFSGNLQTQSVIPSATLSGKRITASGTLLTGVEISVDTRDDAVTPSTGVVFTNGLAFGAKRYDEGGGGASSSGVVRRLMLDLECYVSPISRQVLMIGLHGRQVTLDNIEIADLYRFGGATTLRGYRENQFQGTRVAWSSAEYRFVLNRRSFLFGFLDGGYYYLPAGLNGSDSEADEFRLGYGFGVRLETGIGLLGVSFALGNGDALTEGKIHIGIINEF